MKTFQILVASVITLAICGPAVATNTPIATCPFVISAPGNYFLATDLGPCAGPFAIQIAADHVHLRLEGHTIACSSGADGISANGVQKIKIEGSGTITSCRFGIHWQNVDKSDVRAVTATRNLSGFVVSGGSDNNHFTENVANENSFEGISLDGATNSKLEGNVANNNELHAGIALVSGGGNKLTGNTANGNSLADFPICSIAGGILVGSSGNEIAENTANGNCSVGIGLFAGATENRVVENTALGNHGLDLFDANPDCDANQWVENNFVTSNQGCIH